MRQPKYGENCERDFNPVTGATQRCRGTDTAGVAASHSGLSSIGSSPTNSRNLSNLADDSGAQTKTYGLGKVPRPGEKQSLKRHSRPMALSTTTYYYHNYSTYLTVPCLCVHRNIGADPRWQHATHQRDGCLVISRCHSLACPSGSQTSEALLRAASVARQTRGQVRLALIPPSFIILVPQVRYRNRIDLLTTSTIYYSTATSNSRFNIFTGTLHLPRAAPPGIAFPLQLARWLGRVTPLPCGSRRAAPCFQTIPRPKEIAHGK